MASILKHGLRPRLHRRTNWVGPGKVPSHHEMVYLTPSRTSANFHAMHSALRSGCNQGIVCTFSLSDLDEDKLYPDENYVATKYLGALAVITPQQMRGAISVLKEKKGEWRKSLEIARAVSHRGPIPVDRAVIDHFSIERTEWAWMGSSTEEVYSSLERMVWKAQAGESVANERPVLLTGKLVTKKSTPCEFNHAEREHGSDTQEPRGPVLRA